MKILVLTTTFPRCKDDTTPAFVYELTKRLQKNGFDIVVLAPHHKGAKRFEIMDGMKIYRFPYFWPTKYQKLVYNGGILPNIKRSTLAKIQLPLLFLSELFYAFKIIRKEKIDIIHSHWIFPSGLIGAFYKRIFKISHIITVHGSDINITKKLRILRWIISFVFINSDMITTNSEYTKNTVLFVSNKARNKINVIPMGVDVNYLKYKSGINMKKRFKTKYLILSVGRLIEIKGIKYLILAMKHVVKKIPNTKLIVVGDGPEMKKLKMIAKDNKLEKNIIFTGYIQNIHLPQFYNSADIFVMPSIKTRKGYTEGLGIVLLEAMACGTPVIGSKIGGITDIIKNGNNGFLTTPQNSEDIAKKIINLLESTETRKRFSNNGRKTIQKKFSWNIIVNDFIRLYKEVE